MVLIKERGNNMARKRKPSLLNCEIINAPFNEEQQKEYDKRVCKALATALYRSLEPEDLDLLIESLRHVQ
ncbi:hypothetical protein C3E89_12500 [Clostridium sp. Cult1]|nr:hypothetical protein [Clostridium sp. Cult1]